MGQVKVRYYTKRHRPGGVFGYWQPTAEMKRAGFLFTACGRDGPLAWAKAEGLNKAWDYFRANGDIPRWPAGSLGAAYDEIRSTQTWAEKKAATKDEWSRGWRYIEPIFGDVDPNTVTVQQIDSWYHRVKADAGIREAWRAMKIWRALWRQAKAFRYITTANDPSLAVRRETPQARSAIWREGEIAIRVKRSIRSGYLGLAAVVAVAWDSGFSPVDVRKLTLADFDVSGPMVGVSVARAKTGRPAVARLGKRASALFRAYLSTLPPDQLPAAPVFRNRSGRPYSKDTLGDDWRDMRGDGETRTIADVRRSVAIEALAGGASLDAIGAKLANGIASNSELERTYLPAHEASISQADKARIVGRGNIRGHK